MRRSSRNYTPVEVQNYARNYVPVELTKYDPDQARDDHGRFASGLTGSPLRRAVHTVRVGSAIGGGLGLAGGAAIGAHEGIKHVVQRVLNEGSFPRGVKSYARNAVGAAALYHGAHGGAQGAIAGALLAGALVGGKYLFRGHQSSVRKRLFSTEERKEAAASGAAMPGGRYPIKDAQDLENAYKDYIRTGRSAAVAAHINSRAKALGVESPIGKADGDCATIGNGSKAFYVGKLKVMADNARQAAKLAQFHGDTTGSYMGGSSVWSKGDDGEPKHHGRLDQLFHKSITATVSPLTDIEKRGVKLPLTDGLVWGWASIIEKDGKTVTDHQGDRINETELLKAAHDYVTNSRVGGALHLYTSEAGKEPLRCGEVVESMVFTKDLQKALGVDLGKVGWLIGYRITNEAVRKAAAEGHLPAFSIGGSGIRETVDGD